MYCENTIKVHLPYTKTNLITHVQKNENTIQNVSVGVLNVHYMLYTQAQTLRLGDSVYTAKNSAIDRSHESLNFKIYIVSKIKTEAPF